MTMDCYTTKRSDVCSAADNFCYIEVEYLLDLYTGRDEYDIRELVPDPFPYTYYVDYLNTPKVQQAIGAYVNFSESSPTVGNAFGTTGDDDRLQGSVADTTSLVEQGVYVVMFNGDADYICNWIGNLVVADEVGAAGWGNAGFANMSTSDDMMHGEVKQSNNFVFARIFEAGHEVPFYQPLAAIELFERAIMGMDIATGMQSVSKGCGYMTSGPPEPAYIEGNETVQFKVLPSNSTYNTTTDEPDPPRRANLKRSLDGGQRRRRRLVKPTVVEHPNNAI